MSENVKTSLFAGVALVFLVLAMATRAPVVDDGGLGLGEDMFPAFTDSFDVRKVEIVEFDEEQGDTRGITVEKQDSGRVISSLNNYPADAQDQL